MTIVKYYKQNRKIICYIKKNNDGTYRVCTGKPSDVSCIGWTYDNIKDAEFTADEFFYNTTNFLK